MTQRSVHIVGSYPAADIGEAMTLVAGKAGHRLKTLADGEVGERQNWVVHTVESFRYRDDVELTRDGDWSSYDNRPAFKVKRGHRLSPDSLELGYAAIAKHSYAKFQEIRAAHELGEVPFQVGIPLDLDLALFTFGPARAFTHRGPFRQALAREIVDIAEWGKEDVVFQLECPVELIMVASAPPLLQAVAARFMASGIAKLAAAAPVGARFGVHLCLGDLNHRALKRMKNTAPLVALYRAILAAWPAGRTLEYVHVPLATGEFSPSLEKSFYQQLTELKVTPEDVRFIAGLVHEGQDLDTQQRVLGIVETAIGRTVDVSAPCGLGRRSGEDASRNVDQALALAES